MTDLFSKGLLTFLAANALLPAAVSQAAADSGEPVTELERFIVEESAAARAGDVLPTSRPVGSVYGERSVLETPRSVTVLTAELMEQLEISDLGDLGKLGAGTQQVNYYGVPGTPTLRGAKGSVFFNGMQRAYQRNEMPLSFGSLEALDLVKGPAPAHFGASLVGGYVNSLPKSPYYDKRRGALRVEWGQYDRVTAQLDAGGPVTLLGRPAAWRFSLTAQKADSYYDRIGNDYVSLYGALKLRAAKDLSIFTGGEFFTYNSNENAGWNRPTQELIDRGRYVIGEPIDVTSPAWGGAADRGAIAGAPALVVPRAIVDAGVASGFISAGQRSALNDLTTSAGRSAAYANNPSYAGNPGDGYQYTPAYFAAGGKVFTAEIEGDRVLSDANDFADSENVLWFFDLENRRTADRTLKNQFLLDALRTDKLSTYGYAMQTRQLVLESKFSLEQRIDFLEGLTLTVGPDVRYTEAQQLQDLAAEPFSRRDITRSSVSPNTVVLTGGQRGPNGRNFWSRAPSSIESRLWQMGVFAVAENAWTTRLKSFTSLRLEHAPYSTRLPPEVDQVPPGDPRRTPVSDEKTYYNASYSPVLTVAPGVNLYATFQRGTALDPLQSGALVDKNNFSENSLTEAGAKASVFQDRLFLAVAGYRWKQTRFDTRSSNAEPLNGRGLEAEATAVPAPGWSLLGSVNWQRVERESPLSFRTLPQDERGWALNGGVLGASPPSPANPEVGNPSRNPDRRYPGSPEKQAKLFAIYEHPAGFGASGGVVWSAAYWHNFDHTLRLPESAVWNASVFYRKPRFEIRLRVENLFDDDCFTGAEPLFGANTLLTKAPPRTASLSVTLRL